VPYLGLGPSAHSFDGRVRWHNLRSVGDYCQAIECGARPVAGEERLGDEELRWERVALGLRTSDGVAVADLGGADFSELIERGLVARLAERVVPTPRGLLVADALARQLLFGGTS